MSEGLPCTCSTSDRAPFLRPLCRLLDVFGPLEAGRDQCFEARLELTSPSEVDFLCKFHSAVSGVSASHA